MKSRGSTKRAEAVSRVESVHKYRSKKHIKLTSITRAVVQRCQGRIEDESNWKRQGWRRRHQEQRRHQRGRRQQETESGGAEAASTPSRGQEMATY